MESQSVCERQATHRIDARAALRIGRLALAAVTWVSAFATTALAQQSVAQVAWLQGCWETTSGRATIEEQWMAPRGASMIGMARTVRDGQLVEYEVVVVREDAGRLVYDAHPSGQAPAVFRATSLTDTSIVFENREHDFPQKITYQWTRPDTLQAWVEGPVGGQARRFDFNYRRVACPGVPR